MNKIHSIVVKILSLTTFGLGIFGLIHQQMFTSGGWFNWSQFWHHEPLIAICFVAGAALLLGEWWGQRWSKEDEFDPRLDCDHDYEPIFEGNDIYQCTKCGKEIDTIIES